MDSITRFEIELDSALLTTPSDEEVRDFVMNTLAGAMLDAARAGRDAVRRAPRLGGASDAARSQGDGPGFFLDAGSPPGVSSVPAPSGGPGGSSKSNTPTTLKLGLSTSIGKGNTLTVGATLGVQSGSGTHIDSVELNIKFAPF